MTDILDRYLRQLNDCLASSSANRGNEAADVCSDLSLFCIGNITETEIAYCSSLLFNKEIGIVGFLKKVVLLDEFAKCKEALLILLANYTEKVKKRISPYAIEIKDICLNLFTRDKSSRVKNETFQVLLQLLELKLDPSIVESLKVENMIEKYFSACLQPTKHSATVKYGIYSLLGTFAEFFPEFMVARADRIVQIYVSVLRAEMNKVSKPDIPVIAGCLRGLGSTLVHFTQAVDEGSQYAADIYKFMRKAIDPDINYQRYEVPRAGLSFLARHAAQYKEYLTRDYETVYTTLVSWCKRNNKETRTNAFAAMEMFLKQVAECLVSKGEGELSVEDQTTFKYFIKIFQRIINSNESVTRDISVAIRGYGFFAKPCKLFMKHDDIKFMFNEMIQKSEQMYFNDSELKEEKLQNLPSFLEALGFIVEEMDEIPYAFISSLERLVVVLMEKFPQLGKGPQFVCCKAMLKLFLAMMRKGATLKAFLSQIVYQGLIRTCSHPVALEEGVDVGEDAPEYGEQRTSYKDYLELWQCFLDGQQYKDHSVLWEATSLRQDVHHLVYDELVQAILKVASKLDLSSFRGTEFQEGEVESMNEGPSSTPKSSQSPFLTSVSGTVSDPLSGLQPKAPKDFQIFINLVEFTRKILLETRTEWFENWIYTFGKQLVVLSTSFPLVSGFYKLLEIAMKLSKKLNYFKGTTLGDVSRNVADMDVDQPDFSDCRNCFILFHKFAKEVVVRMKQYKDDLVSSCLQLVLSLPNELVVCDMDVIIPALKMAFKLGLSFLPLAETALDALDTWTGELPPDVLHPYLQDVLPYLDGYLKTASELESMSDRGTETKQKKSTKASTRGHKRGKGISVNEEDNSPLSKVRHRILILLGSLGGRCNLGLLGGNDAKVVCSKGIAWDTKQHLSFAVPFQDMKPTVFLDPFLPRVVELAVNSSDRQTKVAASEVLHSLVLFMLGKSVQVPDTGNKSPLEKLWKRVFPVVVQLACDVEQVCQQLFKPLLLQLIHWFTNNRQYESPDTIVLLDTLLDGIVHPTDTALRDLSAMCVEEFLRWSIKQTSEKQLAKSPINIKSLLKRLYSLASHPSANKRLGAALAFNNIYRVFREEASLVDVFTLEILVVFLESLSMAHHDDKSLGTQSQCIEVLSHLERIIVAKSSMLNKQNKARRVPKGFPIDSVTLPHLVPWLVSKCGRPQTECRHQCMRLVSRLAPLLPGCSSCQLWMKKTLESDGKEYFISRFEGDIGRKTGIQCSPTLSSISGTFSLSATTNWFDLLLAALDSYSWSFGERYLTPSDILAGTQGHKSSVLFQSLTFFIKKLSLNGIEAAVGCFETVNVGVNAQHFSPKEIQEYNGAKCTVVVRLMGFLTLLLQINSEECVQIVPAGFWNSTLFETILSCVFEPQSLGFNMADLEVLEKLPEQTGELCKLLSLKLPELHTETLKESLLGKISLGGRCNLFEQLPLPLTGGEEGQLDHSRLHFLVKGYQQLHDAQILLPALEKQGRWTAEKCSEKLLDSVFQGVVSREDDRIRLVNLTPTSRELALKLLDLAFDLGLKSRSLLQCVLDKTPLTDSKGSSSSLGMVFQQTFQKSIYDFFIKHSGDHLPIIMKYNTEESLWVSSTLIGVLESIVKDKALRKKYAREVTQVLLSSWSELRVWWRQDSILELKRSTVILTRNILLVDPKCLSEVDSSSEMFETYVTLLQDKTMTLTLKTQCLELLPCFTMAMLPEPKIIQLRSALDCLVADHFPLSSREFADGTPKYSDYIAALDKILSSLVVSGSLVLLDLVIQIVCREESHSHEEKVQAQLAKFIKHLNLQQARKALDVCFEIFKNETEHRNQTRRAVIDKVCLVMLRVSSTSLIREFFVAHIKETMTIIEARFSKSSEHVFETQLVSKLCCFELLDVLYAKLEKTDLNSPESRINKAYCNDVKTGKELTMSITKSGHSAKSEDMRGETALLSLRRQYHCAAYNALISVISCTQSELKFYTGFLFNENLTKGQFLLENLVDCTKKLHFEMELSAPIDKRTQLTTIRRQARARIDSDDNGSADYGHSLHYLASQYLADSSLSEEVSQFDFSTPIQAFSQTDSSNDARPSNDIAGEPSSSKDADFDIASEVMEMDELNRHECMPPLITLVNHLTKNKISPPPKQGEPPKEMPPWMMYFHKKLGDHATQLNVKLFIVKLITNIPETFQPYAKFWLTPLMNLILSPDFISEELNYFIVDLLVTMLSWSAVAIPEDSFSGRDLTNRLLECVMKRCNHPTRSIFRNNLEIIKTFIEVWKERIEVPSNVIYEKFSGSDSNKKDNSSGIQLLGIILANKISPYRPGCGVDVTRFYQSLVANLSFKYKEVHAAAAEVIGMSLKYMSENDDKESHDALSSLVYDKLSTMKKEMDKFITCVHQLQVHYPPVIDRFTNQILFVIPNVHGVFKTLCLEIILSRVQSIPKLFLELKTKGFISILNHRDEGCQVACLKIILGLLNDLSVPEISFVLPSITSFSSHKSVVCRELMFDVLIWIYDTYRFDETFKAEEGSEEVLVTAKDVLLQGLADENKDIRLKIRNFWSDETRLPGSTLERLVQVLRAMYSSSTESQFLSYTTNLILQLTSQSPDFRRLIFEQPLSECKFQEYQIDYSWQQRNSTMTPLFASTQMPSSSQGSFGGFSMDVTDGQLRSTQNLQFSLTQATTSAPSQSYNWLNPSSVDNSASFAQSSSVESQTQSSLLFKSNPRRRHFKAIGQGLSSPNKTAVQQSSDIQEDNPQAENIMKLKRRFLKDKSGANVFYAKREITKKKIRQESIEKQKLARENRVVMYRKYRDGDLPDIQIKHSDLIAPLQALAQCDSNIAKQLFSSIFQGIFSQLEDSLTETEAEKTLTDIQSALNTMVSSSSQFFPPFISCIQNICYNERKLSLEPGKVTSTSISSLQQPVGIMLLEKQILQKSDECAERPTKRQKTKASPSPETTTTWIELSKLYKSVEDFDVLRGIFSNQVGTQSITKEALEAEARGDYTKALKLYSDASRCESWPDGDPLQEEEDLWDDSILECCRRLTLWEKLEEYSLVNVDKNDGVSDLSQLWKDEYYQEHYLPFFLRTKTKQFCSGKQDDVFLDFITNSMKDEQQKAYLESRHSDLLAILFILQEDYDRARYYAGNCLQTFLSDWSGLDSMMTASRSAQLQSLQTFTEIQEFLDFIGYEDNFSNSSPAISLVKKWSSREADSKLHSVDIWDDVVTNRIVYMDKILGKYRKVSSFTNSEDSMEVDDCVGNLKQLEDIFTRNRVMFSLRLSEAATEQVNFPVAKKQLQNSLHLIKDTLKNDVDLEVLWTHTYGDLNCKKCLILPPSQAIDTAISAIEQLDKLKDSKLLLEDSSVGVRHHILKSTALDAITKSLGVNETSIWESLSSNTKEKLVGLYGGKTTDESDKVISQLTIRSFKTLQQAVKTSNENMSADSKKKMITSLMTMANFCDRLLRLKEEGEDNVPSLDMKMFPGIIIRYVLKAMTYESTEARQRFPRLLQLVELYPGNDVDAFIRKAADVPCWMFIGWINQMVALLDKQESKAVHDILKEIATHYPQALIYPFKISSEQFKFGGSVAEQENLKFVEGLKDKLSLPLLDTFVAALEQLTNPEMVFKDWIEEVKPLLSSKSNEASIRASFDQMYKKLFDVQKRGFSDVLEMSPIRKRLAKEFSKVVDEKCGNNGGKILAMNSTTFQKEMEIIFKLIKDSKALKSGGNLKDYSPWLSSFQTRNHAQELEIPGQYTGKSKPLPEYHVKIAGFDEKVLPLKSLRVPKRITILGDDEKEYKFLVKGGEDLRLDQRIEQLFDLMNEIMKKDPACRQRNLSLKTYKVIPMTTRIGVIEWLENTTILKDFFFNGMTEKERDTYNSAGVSFDKWLSTYEKSDKRQAHGHYFSMFKKASRRDVERKFSEIQNLIPGDSLKRSFLQLSSSPEAFLMLRSYFARTHGCLSICHYILGIGDRHLSNIMVDLETGGVIGIDFGHAFGSATQFLPLPELMPFRLTRQICNLMLPLRESGQLQSTMVYTLRALKNSHEILVNTMDVFIKEPSLDWQNFARKQADKQNLSMELLTDETWYPREKVNSAKRKLQGVNPAEVMKDDMKMGHHKTGHYKALESILAGDEKFNQRARAYNGTVENQVACLIDQATDPNILGRTYKGWEPWV